MLVTKKTLSNLGSQINDSKGSKVSDFAKKQMERMGWKEGQGLGKNKDGITSHIKVSKKLETTGLGLDESKKEIQSKTEHWWHDDFTQHLNQFKIKNVKSKKKKRKLEEEQSAANESSKGPPSYDELFEATGGARLGMRARAKQSGKHKRTE